MLRDNKDTSMIKLCLLDDHELFRIGLKELFKQQGEFQVIGEYQSNEQCLDNIGHELPDILLLDVTLKDGLSFHMVNVLRCSYPGLKFVVLSMHKGEYYVVRAIEVGVDGYLSKDISTEELFKALKKVARGDKFFSSGISEILINNLYQVPTDKVKGVKVLTEREKEILGRIVQGDTSKEISELLNISKKTVETHRANILKKFGFKSTTLMVRELTRAGVI